jgi:hypothetical protein
MHPPRCVDAVVESCGEWVLWCQAVIDGNDCTVRISRVIGAAIVLRVQSSKDESTAVDIENSRQDSDVIRAVNAGGDGGAVSARYAHILGDHTPDGPPTLRDELLLESSRSLDICEVEAGDQDANSSQLRVKT